MKESARPFSLELAQRDFYGLIDEEMAFNEASIAAVLREIADTEDITSRSLSFLVALASACDNPASEWKVSMSRRKRGRFKSPADSAAQHYRDGWIKVAIEHFTKNEGMKKEAAVALLSEKNGWSRASIFASLKRTQEFEKTIQALGLRELAAEVRQRRLTNSENG